MADEESRKSRRLVAGVVLSLVLWGGASMAHAQALIVVPAGDSAALQAAIGNVSDGGVIELAGGTYASPAGGFAINDRAKRFTMRAAAGQAPVLDGGGARDIVRFINSSVAAGRPVVFEGLTFANGFSATDGIAGGVTVQRAQATFVNCVFQNSTANPAGTGGGGTVVGVGSEAFFIGCLWNGNRARNYGGGLAVGSGSRAVVHASRFVGNRTNLPGHLATAAGGGIHVTDSVLRVTNTRFEGNEAGYVGGGLYALGTWQDPVTTPRADVRVANCTFVGNRARRDPSVTGSVPTEGGAFHAEDQTFAQIEGSRFVTNSADVGGGVNLYRAQVEVRGSVFQGNQAVGTSNSATGFGGAVSAVSNDVADASTGFGAVNRRPASLTLVDSLLQGRFSSVGTVGQAGGCLYAAGDAHRVYGGGGVAPSGTVAENRAVVSIASTVFHDCDVVQTQPATGLGGAIAVDLAGLLLSGSIVTDSDTLAGATSGDSTAGGGVAVFNNSSATISGTTLARNSTLRFGGGLFVQGSSLSVDGCRFLRNSAPGGSFGAGYGPALFGGPDDGRGLAVTGTVANSVITESSGVPIFDDDRHNGPINALVYNANQIRSESGATVYQNALAGTRDVAGLNALVVTRSAAPSTDKSTVANGAPGANPVVGQILAVPPFRLATAPPTESAPTSAYLGYAWGGAASATVDGAARSGGAGLDAAASAGSKVLSVSGSTFNDTLIDAAAPQATLAANPAVIALGQSSTLSWSTPAGTFVEAEIDQGVGPRFAASGSTGVTPQATTTYRHVAVTREGGALALATVTVGAGPPAVGFTGNVQVTEGNGGTVSAVFTVALSWPSAQTVTVSWATASGTATSPADFTAASGSLSFTPGQTSRTLSVSVVGDLLDEIDEAFFVNLSSPQNATIGVGQAQGTILDDDPPPVLAIGDASATEGHTGSVLAAFTLSLSAPSGRSVSVSAATGGGTATAGVDYVTFAGTPTFAPGTTSQELRVAVRGDRVFEADETFLVTLSSPSGATLADTQAVGTIFDDDPQGLSIADVDVVEPVSGTRSAVFTVTLSPTSASTVTVAYSTQGLTASSGADFTPASGTLTFDPGVSTRTLGVSILADAALEGPETFRVNLSGATGAPIAYGQATGRIHDPGAFFSLTPCRVLDTRNPVGPYGGPALAAGASRTFVLAGRCGVPASARAVAVNVAVTEATQPGHLILYPAGATVPLSSTLNYVVGLNRANNAVVGLGSAGGLAIRCGQASGTTHAVLDVTGYFE